MRRFLLLLILFIPLLSLRMLRSAEFSNTNAPTNPDLSDLSQPGRHKISMNVDGHNRTVLFITPQGFKQGETLPIVFFFHGAGGSSVQAAHSYGWAQKADAENFFVAYPQGMPMEPDSGGIFHVWRDGRPHIWHEQATDSNRVDDVHFFSVLLGQLQAALPIDPHRIYVTGFSNGAGMTFALGAHFSDRIAAIAPVSSQSFTDMDHLARPLPIYYIAGTADPLIPYHGGSVKMAFGLNNSGQYPPVQDSVDFWAKLDGCPAQPQIVSDAGGVRVERYGPGTAGVEFFFTTIDGNGHHWPGSQEPLPHAVVGPTLDPFDATDRIWDFFKAHPLP